MDTMIFAGLYMLVLLGGIALYDNISRRRQRPSGVGSGSPTKKGKHLDEHNL